MEMGCASAAGGVPTSAGRGADAEEQDRERQQAGAEAGTSGQPGATPAVPGRGRSQSQREAAAARAAGIHRGRGGAAAAATASLASYFSRRGSVLRPGDSFRVFCSVLSLLKALHGRGAPLGRVRPSVLRITSNGVRSS